MRNIQILEIRACLKFKLNRFFCKRGLISEKPAVATFVRKLAYFEKVSTFVYLLVFPFLSRTWLILKHMLLVPLSQSWLNFLILKNMLLLPLSQSWLNFPKNWLISCRS